MRRVINERRDKENIRKKETFVVDSSPIFLIESTEDAVIRDYTIAPVPPVVSMQVLPDLDPAYFYGYTEGPAYWANWSKPARASDNVFYFAIGDDRIHDSKLYLYKYDPVNNTVTRTIDISDSLAFRSHPITDGKIHARLCVDVDGTIWGTTHSSVYEEDKYQDLIGRGLLGSWLFSYNTMSHDFTNWGNPLPNNTLPEANLDTKRGKYFCVSAFNEIVCWDTTDKKILYSDKPPDGWVWWDRASLLDTTSGKFWTTDDSDDEKRFMSYDPSGNSFTRYDVGVPPNPYTQKSESIRAYTDNRACDGAFYCISKNGVMFRFWPEKPAVELMGLNWDKGRYTSTMAMDPEGRYIYFMPGGDKGQNANDYAPLVQFDVTTGKKKVLAWLGDYYYEKYGYWLGGTYGMEISLDGSFLVIVMNGAFRFRETKGDFPYGCPSLFIVKIPE